MSLMTFNSFIPMQPAFALYACSYVEHKDVDYSNQITTLYYQFQLGESFEHFITTVPDGCIDILFLCDSKKPLVSVHGTRLQKKPINLQKGIVYFGVRFIPNLDGKDFYCSLKELVDSDVSFQDFMGIDPCITQKIINESLFEGRVKLYKKHIGKSLFEELHSSQRVIKYAVNKIYSLKGNITINQLSNELGYSSRYLRKVFEERVGISPKLFCQISRYQFSLQMLVNQKPIFDVIHQNGYYDQSHFINECKKFSNDTPTQIKKYCMK